MDTTHTLRKQLIRTLFPDGVPELWCPLLTHYQDDGSIDTARMARHAEYLRAWIRGYLIPGSTGDGWELDASQKAEVLTFSVRMAQASGARILVGILETDPEAMLQSIADSLAFLKQISGEESVTESLAAARVCGFTVCPPKGKSLSQEAIHAGLSQVMSRGVPIALYQLPQVTGNEVDPKSFEALASQFDNFIFFKDTSGSDRIALSGRFRDSGIFFVRGTESDYIRWLKSAGGPYDGLLLSSANTFPEQLAAIIKDSKKTTARVEAERLSTRLSDAMSQILALVQDVPSGNPFANAGKAIDHYCAFGAAARKLQGPRLHSGRYLSSEIISATGDILNRYGLMAEKGYLV
ncbi:MAG: dihydrodipicolinate synthase family protein [Candidatus Neomarinimicrobiota bacterium]